MIETTEHDRARELLLLSGVEGVTATDERWLEAHTGACDACADFARSIQAASSALRTMPTGADAALVTATQARLRHRAAELAEHRAHTRMVLAACVLAVASTAATAPFLWQGMAWLGGQAGVPNPFWQLGFFTALSLPALLGGAVLLAARQNGHAEVA